MANLSPRIAMIEENIAAIHTRNRRVEADKAWETSWTRRIIIAALTYIVISITFFAAHLPRPLINAIIPSIAFLCSTLTIQGAKRFWLHRREAS